METTILKISVSQDVYWGYFGIMENKMEAIGVIGVL